MDRRVSARLANRHLQLGSYTESVVAIGHVYQVIAFVRFSKRVDKLQCRGGRSNLVQVGISQEPSSNVRFPLSRNVRFGSCDSLSAVCPWALGD